jgi:hypothetical protein
MVVSYAYLLEPESKGFIHYLRTELVEGVVLGSVSKKTLDDTLLR